MVMRQNEISINSTRRTVYLSMVYNRKKNKTIKIYKLKKINEI